MFTTDGPTCSTSSVKSGRPRTCAHAEPAGTTANDSVPASAPIDANARNFFQFN
jgi:hypothetical protein